MSVCPHKDVRFCPLYLASHGGKAFNGARGCDDGSLDEGGCGVDHGYDYHELVGRMKALAPGYVEQLKWREELEEAKAQRARNMAAAGLH